MLHKLKKFFGFNSDFDNLIEAVRQNNCENWKQMFDTFQSTNSKPMPAKDFSTIGLEIYGTIFKKMIADLKITAQEKQALKQIEDYFSISKIEIDTLQSNYSKDAVRKLSLEKYDDSFLSDEERVEIQLFASELNISYQEVDNLHKTIAQTIYKKAVEKAILDNEVTAIEQHTLEQLAINLHLQPSELNLDTATDETYNYLVLLNALNDGYLPTLLDAAIVVQKNEIVHWQVPAHLLITKTVTTGYTAASRGISIRIMKGVSYRVGTSRSTPIKEQIAVENPGVLVITNKRIVFSSTTKSFAIPFTKLISFIPYSDGLGLQKENASYLLRLRSNELAEVIFKILTNAIHKTYE